MRIAITSDLHYPMTSKNTILDMINSILLAEVDVVCLAGDIGESRISPNNFRDCVEFFTNEFKNVCVIAGNHDLWSENNQSQLLWDSALEEFCYSVGAKYLEKKNFVKDGVAICGSYVHYDYSARSKDVEEEFDDAWFATHKDNFNNDANFLKLKKSDKIFSHDICGRFIDRMRGANGDTDVHSIVAMTHVPCFESQVPRKLEWTFSNAYFGNLSFSREILGISKLKHFVSGHTHCATEEVKEIGNRIVKIATLGSDYRKPLFVVVEV